MKQRDCTGCCTAVSVIGSDGNKTQYLRHPCGSLGWPMGESSRSADRGVECVRLFKTAWDASAHGRKRRPATKTQRTSERKLEMARRGLTSMQGLLPRFEDGRMHCRRFSMLGRAASLVRQISVAVSWSGARKTASEQEPAAFGVMGEAG